MSKNKEDLIFEKLDSIDTRIDRIDVTLVKQEANIDHHIKRTDTLEQQLQPIHNSHQQIIGVLKFLGFVSLALAIYQGLVHLF